MPRPIRVGAVNYLNTKPLIERPGRRSPRTPSCPRPAQPAGRPARRRRPRRRPDPGHRVLPGRRPTRSCPASSIASRGPVLSVTLFSRVPWPEIRRSPWTRARGPAPPWRRSCCEKRYGVQPAVVPLPMDVRGRGHDDRRGAADRRPGDAGLPAGLRPRLRPGPGVVRLDRPAVRLRRLGRARRGGPGRRGPRRLAAGEATTGWRRPAPIAQREAASARPRRRLLPPLPEQHPALRPGPARSRPACATGFAASWPRDAADLAPDEGCDLDRSTDRTRILSKAVDGERLTPDEGVALFDCRDLHALGRAADAVTPRLHPEPYRTYNIDRNINYTNVCAAVCDFCAFYRKSATPTPTSCRARSCTRRSRRPSPWAATRSSCRAACTRR